MTLPALMLTLPLLTGCFGKDDPTDEDGGGDDGGVTEDTDADGDGYAAAPEGDDCDDADPDVNPFADERCDGIDNDCDGVVDEDAAVDATRWYPDEDGDGYGDDDAADQACDPPEAGWIAAGGDCDDDEERINPGMIEQCNGFDDDCDEDIDEDDAEDAETWYLDGDEDGFGGETSSVSCDSPALGDEVWTLDGGDCNDDDDAVNPDATEVCNDQDDDCDDLVDDADPSVDESSWTLYYADDDGDGFGDAARPTLSCSAPADHVLDDTDCDDEDEEINPAADEICDAGDSDEDCNGSADDDDPGVASAGLSTWVRDADRDGYGSDSATPVFACDDPGTGSTHYVEDDDSDCDDGDAGINPGADEVCDPDNTDEDCSGDADDDDGSVLTSSLSDWYLDGDGDGYGSSEGLRTQCDDPSTSGSAYVADATDCDDDRDDVNPGEDEICDEEDTDEDCSGEADDDDDGTTAASKIWWYLDADGDGFGDDDRSLRQCEEPTVGSADWITADGDCDDDDASINPDAEEICDDLDNDCDPSTTTDGGASFAAADGTVTDLTDDFDAGSSSSMVDLTLDEDGTLSLCGGTFYGHFTVSGDVTVQGYDDSVVSGGGSWTPFYVDVGGALALQDLTLEDGAGEYGGRYDEETGGGLIWADEATLSLDNVTVQDGTAYYGGCLFYSTSTVTVRDSVIQRCEGIIGGAVYDWYYNDTEITDSVIRDNSATYNGGAFYIVGGDLLLSDSVVSDNSGSYGAAVYQDSSSTVTCEGSASVEAGFLRNTSSLSGVSSAAIYLPYSSTVFVADACDFGEGRDDNSRYDLYGNYLGSFSWGADVTTTCSAYGSCD